MSKLSQSEVHYAILKKIIIYKQLRHNFTLIKKKKSKDNIKTHHHMFSEQFKAHRMIKIYLSIKTHSFI